MQSNRREFGKVTLGAAVLPAAGFEKKVLAPLTPGAKITLQLPGDFNDEDLQFAKQIGVNYVNLRILKSAWKRRG
jgi:hypothetical protein